VRSQVLDWAPSEVSAITKMILDVAKKFADSQLHYPNVIQLVKTTGNDEGAAAYTRGFDTIVLPQNYLNRSDLEDIIIHELFHLFSKNNKDQREKLYSIIHYLPTGNDVQLPQQLAERQITNPDTPEHRYYIELDYQGQPTPMLPILYTTRPYEGGSLFEYLNFKMILLEGTTGNFKVKLSHKGKYILVDVANNAEYQRKIGITNLGHSFEIFHPDEIMAQNWVFLMDNPVRSILDKMADVLHPKK